MELFIFASEIAGRKVSEDSQCSLDDLLCDPELAARFDQYAKLISPGYSSFQYRWAALTVRKWAGVIKQYMGEMSGF